MKSLSATCCLLLVAGVAVFVMTAIQPSSMAFADAVEQPQSARMLSYTRLLTVEGNPKPIKSRELFAEDGRHRNKISECPLPAPTHVGIMRLHMLVNQKETDPCRTPTACPHSRTPNSKS